MVYLSRWVALIALLTASSAPAGEGGRQRESAEGLPCGLAQPGPALELGTDLQHYIFGGVMKGAGLVCEIERALKSSAPRKRVRLAVPMGELTRPRSPSE